MDVGTAELALLVSALACGAALMGALRNTKKDTGEDAAKDARVMTELKFIGNDLKDIKAEYRSTREELKDIRGIAEHANERAEAAHHRLDRAGIDTNTK